MHPRVTESEFIRDILKFICDEISFNLLYNYGLILISGKNYNLNIKMEFSRKLMENKRKANNKIRINK